MKNYFTPVVGLLLAGWLTPGVRSAHAQSYRPITLTAASFTADIIANGSAANPPANSTTADMDGAGYYYMSQDYYTATTSHTSGLPNNGTISSNSAGPAALTYQLASVSANNSLRLTNTASGTLTFATPTAATEVYVLGATGSGSGTVTLTINYSDGTSSAFTNQTYPDWFTVSSTQNVFAASGRASSATPVSATTANNSAPFLNQVKLTVPTAKQGSPIASIGVTKTSTSGVVNIMAVSITNVAPLPVQLVRFSAQRGSTGVALTWTTASELANAGFAIERSADGTSWHQLAFVAGSGNSAQARYYHYTDSSAPRNAQFYRLRQVDFGGATTYSPIQLVAQQLTGVALLLYPNPAQGLVQISGVDPTAVLRLLTAQGQLVRELPAGTTSFDSSSLPAGLYVLRAGQATQRLLVQ